VLLFAAPRVETTKIIVSHFGPVYGAVNKNLNFKCVYVIDAGNNTFQIFFKFGIFFASFDYFWAGILLGLEELKD
jgi:hypothetical protein